MPFTIPNVESTPSFNGQANTDATDIAIMAAAANGTGVISGCLVSSPTTAGMAVNVAAGSVCVQGVIYNPTAVTNLAVTSASSTDRRDLVVYTVGTGYQVLAGTPTGTSGANYPVKPGVGIAGGFFNPLTMVALGEVYVASTTTAITTGGNIIDKTLTYQPGVTGYSSGAAAPALTLTGTMQTYLTTASLGIGTWAVIVTAQAEVSGGSTQRLLNHQCIAGTATGVTVQANSTLLAAQNIVSFLTAGNGSLFTVAGTVAITGAGTLLMQATVATDGELANANYIAIQLG